MTTLRLTLLALATFVYVTFEVFPVGLIGEIARDLSVSEGRIGLLVSGYAVVAGIATIPSVRLVARWSRKRALLVSLTVLLVAEIVAALAHAYPLMVASRVLAALTHGILWSLVAPTAATLVEPGRTGMATSVVFGGATAAAVAGSPLATLLGDALGWRVAALVLAGLTAVVLAGLAATLPAGSTSRPGTTATAQGTERRSVLQGPLLIIFGLAIVVVFAHFASFTYVALLVERVVEGSGSVPAFLALFGVAGAVGTYLVGRYSDVDPGRATVISVGVLVLGTGGVAAAVGLGSAGAPVVLGVVVLGVAVVAWGGAIAAIGPSYQAGVMRVAGDRVDAASSVYVTCYQVGIASGSAVGAVLVGPALGVLPVLSVAAAALAFLVTLRVRDVYAGRPPVGGSARSGSIGA